jgi:hypothetical protein
MIFHYELNWGGFYFITLVILLFNYWQSNQFWVFLFLRDLSIADLTPVNMKNLTCHIGGIV